MLLVAVYILTLAFGVALLCVGVWFRRAKTLLHKQMEARVEGREPKSIDHIQLEDWKGGTVDKETFERVWLAAAECFRVDHRLLRLSDRVDALIIESPFWPGPGDDLAEFFADLAPACNAYNMAGRRFETVGDVVQAGIELVRHSST